MKALIIGSGFFSKKALELLDEDFYTICADGGYDSAVKCGIIPDIVIGDMGSVKENPDQPLLLSGIFLMILFNIFLNSG